MVNDRGQLLLIGAITIALAIVGTVVLLNDMQYTDAAGSQSRADVLTDAERIEDMVARDVAVLAMKTKKPDDSDPVPELRSNITAYSNYSRNMSLTGGTGTVNVSLNESESGGVRARQSSSGPLGSGGVAFNVLTDVDAITRFNVTITDPDTGGPDDFVLQVIGDGGDRWKMRVTEAAGDVRVQTQDPGSGSWETRCTESASVNLHLVNATGDSVGETGPCPVSVNETLSAPYTIRFSDGDQAEGTYTIEATSAAPILVPSFDSDYPAEVAVDYEYRTPDITYNRTIYTRGAGGLP